MTNTPEHAVVWAEIPVRNLEKAMQFYSAVLQTEIKVDDMSPQPAAMLPATDYATSIAGHIYEGTPTGGGGITIHLAINGTVEDARDRVFEAGGTSSGDIVTMPFGRYVYCKDLDGNPIGLFEAA